MVLRRVGQSEQVTGRRQRGEHSEYGWIGKGSSYWIAFVWLVYIPWMGNRGDQGTMRRTFFYSLVFQKTTAETPEFDTS